MKAESIFLKYIGDNPRMRVLQYLIEGRNFDYTITDLLNANVSWGTLNKLLPEFFKLSMVIKTRKIGRATLYRINQDNNMIKQLMKLYDDLILQRLEKIDYDLVRQFASSLEDLKKGRFKRVA